MLILKIRCQDEIRRISLEKDPTFHELVSTLKKLFNVDENSNEELLIKYVDEDEDFITIATDTDLSECLRVYYQQKLAMLKLFLTKYFLTEEQFQQKRQKLQLSSTPAPKPLPTEEKITKVEPVVVEKSKEPIIEPKKEIVVPKKEEPQPIPQTIVPAPVKEEPKIQSPPTPVEQPQPVAVPVKDNTEEDLAKRLGAQTVLTPTVPEPSPKPVEDDGEWIEFKTRTGKTVFLNLKAGSLQRYGIEPFTRVNTIKGAATVFGTDKDRGFLWFQLDKDQGVSFWDDITNYDSLLAKGVSIIEQPKNAVTPPVTAPNKVNINSNPVPVHTPTPPTLPKASINNNSAWPAAPRPPVWDSSKAAQYGFANDDEEARLIEMAVAESLKTVNQQRI